MTKRSRWYGSVTAWVLLLLTVFINVDASSRRPWRLEQSHSKQQSKSKINTSHRWENPAFRCERGGGYDGNLDERLLQELLEAAPSLSKNQNIFMVPKSWHDVQNAIDDLTRSSGHFVDNTKISPDIPAHNNNHGRSAWDFLQNLAQSETFVSEYWHQRPLLIRSKDIAAITSAATSADDGRGNSESIENSSWVDGIFTLEGDLKRGVDQSYIAGHKTADILRNGTKTDTWLLEPLRTGPKSTATSTSSTTTTTSWTDVEQALQGGTIYFNTAGSLWPSCGALCRLAMYSFGLPVNCNVYVTPPACSVSVPPHTDRQDVLVLQTEGYKRWRVYRPPKRQSGDGRDPLERGKQGDVLSLDELGQPLIDTTICPGDVLYVPTGFPHTTDTLNVSDHTEGLSTFHRKNKASVHLTVGLDTHVWMLTMAHLRWALLQRCSLDFRIQFDDDKDYWSAIETLPVGFLARTYLPENCWEETVDSLRKGTGVTEAYLNQVAERLQELLVRLEPNRWKTVDNDFDPTLTKLPSLEDMKKCISFMVESHWNALLDSQDNLSKVPDMNDNKEEAIIKAFQGTQQQDLIMEKFANFCGSVPMAQMYAQRRMLAKTKTQGLY